MKHSILQLLFPPSIALLLKRLGLAFLLLTVTRLVFLLLNVAYFKEASFLDFVLGLRFDASVVAYFFSAFIVLSLFPITLHRYKVYRFIQAFFFFVPLSVVLLMNLSDAVYFRFIFRRTTFDVLRYFSSPSSDGWRLLSTFALHYWYIPLLFVILLMFAGWGYRKAGEHFSTEQEGWKTRSIAFLLSIALIVLGGRGGLQLVPITLVDAGLYTSPRFMPLVLNTPFSFVTTAFQSKQEPVYYFSSPQEANSYFSIDYCVKPSARSFKGKNIVVLILESFGQEYTGYYNKKGGYTPFLDSLLKDSYVFVNAFANGKQSVDAVPAIISGIPGLTQEPFIASGYAANRMPSLASYFVEQGYTTQFFHGGVNGTMGFEAFSQSAGVQNYYGKDQYPEVERDFDGNWGIFDEPYLKYFANELTKNDKPFFSVLFTLSSHHPYTIPKKYKGKFPKGNYEILESIGYADYALSQFFKEAQRQPWYNNTLFIITADHTSHSDVRFYQEGLGMYAVPMAFFDPQGHWKGIDSTIIQHVDLFPTVIGLTGGEVKGKFFGRNVFDRTVSHEVINYNYGGTYHYLRDGQQAQFNGDSTTAVYLYPKDSSMTNDVLPQFLHRKYDYENIIKAKIQAYYTNMEENTWYFDFNR
jgi:phosphoglycerol transferase MdoB-like AlkP superfamily enzyme